MCKTAASGYSWGCWSQCPRVVPGNVSLRVGGRSGSVLFLSKSSLQSSRICLHTSQSFPYLRDTSSMWLRSYLWLTSPVAHKHGGRLWSPGELGGAWCPDSRNTQYFVSLGVGLRNPHVSDKTPLNPLWTEERLGQFTKLISTHVRFVGISPICIYWLSPAGCTSGSEFLMSQRPYQTPLYSLLSKLWGITIVLKMIGNAHKWKPCTQLVRFSKSLLIRKGNYKT